MYSKEIRAKIIKKYSSGVKVSDIAKEFKCAPMTVYRFVKEAEVYVANRDLSPEKRTEYGKMGAKARCKNLIKKGRIIYGHTTKHQERDIIEASKNKFIAGICREKNCISAGTVKKILKANNEPAPMTDRSRVHTTTYVRSSDYLRVSAYLLHENGMKLAKIREYTGIKENTISTIVAKFKADPDFETKYAEIIKEIKSLSN